MVSAGVVGLDDPLVSIVSECGLLTPRLLDVGQDPHSKLRLPTPPHLIGQTIDPAHVTIRHLLTDTSALVAWRDVYHAAGPVLTPPDPIPRGECWLKGLHTMCAYPFVARPGQCVIYSDIGLMIVGEAFARLGRAPLDTVMQQQVLSPAALSTVCFNPVQEHHIPPEHIAPTEDDPSWRQRRVWGEVHDENACGLGGVTGHAGLFATAFDVARFGQIWLNEPERVFGVNAALAHEAKQQYAETDGSRRRLGFALKALADSSAGDHFSPSTYGHNGFTGPSLLIEPQNALVVACLTNRVYMGRHKEGVHDFQRNLHDLLAAALNR